MEPQELREFLQWEPNFPDAVLDKGLLYAGTKAILYGQYKAGKSPLVQRLALHLARGQPWLGFKVPSEGISVFYLQLEIPAPLFQKRVKSMTDGRWLTKKPLTLWTEHYLKLDLDQGLSKLERYLDRWQPQVLIVDPIYKVLSADVTKPYAVTPFLDNMDKLLDRYDGMAIVLTHHGRKPSIDEKEGKWGSDDMLGAGLFSAWADSIIKVERKDRELKLRFEVIRHAEEDIKPVTVTLEQLFSHEYELLEVP